MPNPSARGRIEGLDLLRGLAILLVMARHAFMDRFGGGGITGVCLFFVLSGFLITGVLMRDIQRFGRVRYGHFYRNRILRLMPPLVAMLAVYALVTLTVNPAQDQAPVLKNVLIGVLYLGNFSGLPISFVLGHLWTLANEEQFYLVWPIVLFIGVRIRHVGLIITLAAIVITIALLMSIQDVSPHYDWIYKRPTSWALAMVAGAVGYLWQDQIAKVLPRQSADRIVLSIAALLGLISFSLLPEAKSQVATYLVGVPLISVLSLVLILHLRHWGTIPNPIYRPILMIGTVSYAAYLWNFPIVNWMGQSTLTFVTGIVSIVASLFAAGLSWFVIERPVQRLRRRLDGRGRTEDVTSTPPTAAAAAMAARRPN